MTVSRGVGSSTVKVVADEVYTAKLENRITYEGKERATIADGCRHVSDMVSVQYYTLHLKGYNLIGVTTVEASATRGMTALVY